MDVLVGPQLMLSTFLATSVGVLLTALPDTFSVAGMADTPIEVRLGASDLSASEVKVGVYDEGTRRTTLRTFSTSRAVAGQASRWPRTDRARQAEWRLWIYGPRSTHPTGHRVRNVSRSYGRQFNSLSVEVDGDASLVEPDSTIYLTS